MKKISIHRALPRTLTPVLVFMLMLMLLPACTKRIPTGTLAAPQEAQAVWQRYAALCAAHDVQKPYRVQMSLRYGTEGDTRRVTALLWGNNASHLRMDVNAGVGATVAKIQDNDDYFLVYAPTENKAYFHQGSQKPLLDVGVPMPFGVTALAELLNGRYGAVFGNSHSSSAEMTSAGNMRYTVEHGRSTGTLELDNQGLPLRWQDKDTQGWVVQFGYEDGSPLPYKLDITHGKSAKRAVVLVKDRNWPTTPFTELQLHVILPEDTPLLPLRQFKQA